MEIKQITENIIELGSGTPDSLTLLLNVWAYKTDCYTSKTASPNTRSR